MKEAEEIMKLHHNVIASKQFTFPQTGNVNVSDKHGVYIVYSQSDAILHVGTTKRGKEGLNQRLNNHISGTSSFRKEYLKPKEISLRDGYKFKYIEVENARTRALLEALTAGLLCPAHFGTGEKI